MHETDGVIRAVRLALIALLVSAQPLLAAPAVWTTDPAVGPSTIRWRTAGIYSRFTSSGIA